MGEPSLWNLIALAVSGLALAGFNPSWESRPSGTRRLVKWVLITVVVSTPHGRAVPLELFAEKSLVVGRGFVSTPHGRAVPLEPEFEPSWPPALPVFQPLMGEPSLWNLLS